MPDPALRFIERRATLDLEQVPNPDFPVLLKSAVRHRAQVLNRTLSSHLEVRVKLKDRAPLRVCIAGRGRLNPDLASVNPNTEHVIA
jgi:hypothetical protein